MFDFYPDFVRHRVSVHRQLVGEECRSTPRRSPLNSSGSGSSLSLPPSMSLTFEDLLVPVAPPPALSVSELLSSSTSRQRRAEKLQRRGNYKKEPDDRYVWFLCISWLLMCPHVVISRLESESSAERKLSRSSKRARVASSLATF